MHSSHSFDCGSGHRAPPHHKRCLCVKAAFATRAAITAVVSVIVVLVVVVVVVVVVR